MVRSVKKLNFFFIFCLRESVWVSVARVKVAGVWDDDAETGVCVVWGRCDDGVLSWFVGVGVAWFDKVDF